MNNAVAPPTIYEEIKIAKSVITNFKIKVRSNDLDGAPEKIRQVRDFLITNFDKCRCTIEMMHEQLDISSHSFAEEFRNHFGSTPLQFLLHLRCESASELLNNSCYAFRHAERGTT